MRLVFLFVEWGSFNLYGPVKMIELLSKKLNENYRQRNVGSKNPIFINLRRLEIRRMVNDLRGLRVIARDPSSWVRDCADYGFALKHLAHQSGSNDFSNPQPLTTGR
jgi:hypothetical protein